MSRLELLNYGSGHLALVGAGAPRIDFDPALPSRRKRRDEALSQLETDIVVVTRGDADSRQDALDVVEGTEAIVVGPSTLTAPIERELDLGEEAVDLEDWERAKAGPWRFLLVPSPHKGIVNDLVGTPADLFQGSDLMGRTLSSLPMLGDLTRGLPMMPGPLGQKATTRALIHVEKDGEPAVVFVGDALMNGADRDWIEDVGETVKPEVVVAAVGGSRVDGLVWAVREWAPKHVVLYRDHDPYENGDAGLPIARFVEAITEDAPGVTVSHLRSGERLALA